MTQIGEFSYDPHTAITPQVVDYDCSAASTAWFGRSIGWDWSEVNVLWEFSKEGLISPEWGLLDGTGAGIVRWLAMQPITALNGPLTWDDLITIAGYGPIIVGGAAWYHWVGVREWVDAPNVVEIANPAPGYKGIGQTLTQYEWNQLGPFNGVWLPN